jgi:hypothetical protein
MPAAPHTLKSHSLPLNVGLLGDTAHIAALFNLRVPKRVEPLIKFHCKQGAAKELTQHAHAVVASCTMLHPALHFTCEKH